jgi:hypothetical protein
MTRVHANAVPSKPCPCNAGDSWPAHSTFGAGWFCSMSQELGLVHESLLSLQLSAVSCQPPRSLRGPLTENNYLTHTANSRRAATRQRADLMDPEGHAEKPIRRLTAAGSPGLPFKIAEIQAVTSRQEPAQRRRTSAPHPSPLDSRPSSLVFRLSSSVFRLPSLDSRLPSSASPDLPPFRPQSVPGTELRLAVQI